MRPLRAALRRTIAFAAIALAACGAGAASELTAALSLRLVPLETLPSERWRAEVVAGPAIVAVRFAVEGRPAELDRHAPFRTTLRLEPPFSGPVWIEAIGLDDQGRERARDGRCVHLPADRDALRLVRVGESEAVVLVQPAAGHRVERLEGIRPDGSVFASAVSLPFRFSIPGPGPFAARARFDDGAVAAAWDPGAGQGEIVQVRLGQARWLAPAGDAPPSPESVHVLSQGRQQRVLRLVGGDATGLELGLAVDVSESTGPRFDELRAATRAVAAALIGPGDRTFLVTFSQQSELVASARGDLEQVLTAVPSNVRSDKTRIYDGLAFSLLQFHAEDPRAALVVLTDACDTTKRPDVDRVRELARARAIPIYALLLDQGCVKLDYSQDFFGNIRTTYATDRALTYSNRTRLEQLTRDTGGRAVPLGDGEGIEAALRLILRELDRQWLVVFEPSSESVSSEEVEVRLGAPGRSE